MEVKPITYPTNYLSFSSLYYIVNINDYDSRGGGRFRKIVFMIFNFHSNMNNIKFSEDKLFVSEATLQKAPVCLSVSPSHRVGKKPAFCTKCHPNGKNR